MKGCCFVFEDVFYDKLSLFIAVLLDLASYIREKIIKYDKSSYGNLKNIKIVLIFLNYALHPVFCIITQKIFL